MCMSEASPNLQKILNFATLLNKFRAVTRVILVNGEDRYENDVEHSYMLTMLADYIISVENLSLDRQKVMSYCLVHDFVEVYAGDTPLYSKDKKYIESKHLREAQALKQIISEFPEHKNMYETISVYEEKKDDESRFVYALDKVQPIIQNYLDGGRIWKKEDITLTQIKENKKEKVAMSPIVEKYWKELEVILERNKSTLFPK